MVNFFNRQGERIQLTSNKTSINCCINCAIWTLFLLTLTSHQGLTQTKQTDKPKTAAKQVMLMNRIGPTSSELYMANIDGTNEHKLFSGSSFDYNASYSPDGNWIVFTSERDGFGQADIYRVHPDGTKLEQLTKNSALDDQAAMSPDGSQVAFVSTIDSHTANICILDIKTKKLRNLSGLASIQGDPSKPNGFFRPTWSPDGKWIAFSSDKDTEWRGHGNGSGWEHVQELKIYIVHPDGTGLRTITQPGICSGAPSWSPTGNRIVFYEIPIEDTWAARRPPLAKKATSQIVSVSIETGERVEHTSGPGLKLEPQYISENNIGYLTKAIPNAGLAYTVGNSVQGDMRSPSWSPNGKEVIYEKEDYTPWPQNTILNSWDTNYEYRYTNVFPNFSKDGKLVVTQKDVDGSIVIMDEDGSNKKIVYAPDKGSAAFAPSWSPDGQWIAFGYGGYLQSRKTQGAKIMMVKRDGTNSKDLTDGLPNSGFPSWSPDGKKIVYRVWGEKDMGLRILDLNDHSIKVLTTEYDNLPFWSPDGSLITFTRRHEENNFDIFTIKPDGTGVRQLTSSPANDAHALWTEDGKQLLWSSGIYGFKDEAPLYENNFQPYGTIFIMKSDGSEKRQLSDSRWEDSMAKFVPQPRRP